MEKSRSFSQFIFFSVFKTKRHKSHMTCATCMCLFTGHPSFPLSTNILHDVLEHQISNGKIKGLYTLVISSTKSNLLFFSCSVNIDQNLLEWHGGMYQIKLCSRVQSQACLCIIYTNES